MTSLNVWKVLEPDKYYESFIKKHERPDKRKWMKARPITLRVGSIHTAEGSATVRLGNTSVICGVKAEVAVPTLKHPEEGFIIPDFELYPCASLQKSQRAGEKANALRQLLASVIESSKLIDKKSLCIYPNKAVWCLNCDIICLDHDGNITDAAVLALVAALEDTKIPKLHYDPETERTVLEKGNFQRIMLQTRPVATTFLCYSSEIYLLDPSAEDEREAGEGDITIVHRDSDSLCFIHKMGGHPVPEEALLKFLDVARDRAKYMRGVLSNAIKK